jgi:hypothetical protein
VHRKESLAGKDLGQLYTNEWLLLGGRVHLLAFDLFVGSGKLCEAHGLGVARYSVIACLALTFLFDPAAICFCLPHA